MATNVNMNEVFGIPCECLTDMTNIQENAASYYAVIDVKLYALFNSAIAKMLFGYECTAQKLADAINNIHYMFFYLQMIRMEMDNEIGLYNQGYVTTLTTIEEYAEKYYLECIRKNMACNGVEMLHLYDVFGLNYVMNPDDGIGYMAIVPHGTYSPDNRIY